MAQPPRFVVSAIMAARRRLQQAADAVVPAEVVLLDKSSALASTHVLGVVAELGLPDHLAAGPKTAAELAAELDVDARTLHRVLRAAATMDVLSLDRAGRFRLTRLGQPLRSDHPRSVRSWPRYLSLPSTTLPWTQLLDSVRTGRGAFARAHGRSVWEQFAGHPEEAQLFNDAMRGFTEQQVPGIVAAYPWPEQGIVCDVAGGVGTLLAGDLTDHPGLRGVMVDSVAVLTDAEQYLAKAGLRARVDLTGGDIFTEVDATADVYLIKDVLHDWDDAACARILGTVRATAPPGLRIVLVESTLEHSEAHPLTTLIDMIMLVQSDGGRQRSVTELQSMLTTAGVTPAGIYRTPGPLSLIEGIAT